MCCKICKPNGDVSSQKFWTFYVFGTESFSFNQKFVDAFVIYDSAQTLYEIPTGCVTPMTHSESFIPDSLHVH